jgi:site-specific DNA-methyltransferase (adenine-specific)
VLEHGTGGLNIDGCRVATDPSVDDPRLGGNGAWKTDKAAQNVYEGGYAGQAVQSSALGRWPANLIHDGSDEVVGLFPITTSGARKAGSYAGTTGSESLGDHGVFESKAIESNTGSAARFFYCAKASKRDRDEGLEAWPEQQSSVGDDRAGGDFNERLGKTPGVRRNVHPTVKPTDLMRYLCRLVTPPGGVVLDPFMGSGSTGKAAKLEGFEFVGCEMSPEYFETARARIEAASKELVQDSLF